MQQAEPSVNLEKIAQMTKPEVALLYSDGDSLGELQGRVQEGISRSVTTPRPAVLGSAEGTFVSQSPASDSPGQAHGSLNSTFR